MFDDNFRTESFTTVIPDTGTAIVISAAPFTALTPLQTVRREPLPEEVVQLTDGSPNRPAVHEIVSRYFTAPIQCKNVVDKLVSLYGDASITLNELVKNTSSGSRPIMELRIQMLEELHSLNLFVFKKEKRNYIIKKY